jgi:hypothetical protein
MPTASGSYYYEHRESVPLPLTGWREVSTAGAVGDTTANGGLLSSNTTPILGAAATSEAMIINWAAGNSDIIQCSVALPPDFSGKDDVFLDLFVLTDNTGGGGIEAGTFSVLTSWDNGAQVTDEATDGTPATTAHKITARMIKDDIPDFPSFVNIQLVLGTHANDPVHMLAGRLTYVPLLKAAP